MITLKDLHSLLPPSELEQLAATYELDSANQVKLSGPTMFVCLLNGIVNHQELTLRLLEEIYQQQTGDTADHSSFSKCLGRINPSYFGDLFGRLRQRLAPQTPLQDVRALRLRFVDATIVTLSAKLLHFGLWARNNNPDKPRRQVKTVLELTSDALPNFLHLCTDKSEHADSVALGATMHAHSEPGDFWIFDKGCDGRDRLLALHQAGAFFLTPQHTQKVRCDRLLLQTDPSAFPSAPPGAGQAQFVITRVIEGVFENSQERPKNRQKWASMPLILIEGFRFDQRSKTWKPLTLMTNLPLSADGQKAGTYTFAELAQVYAQRWDIEVFFKFIKQNLSYSHLTSRCENGIRVMIYMSLIAALLLIWYKQQTGINRGWRSVKFWFAENVRAWTTEALQAASLVSQTTGPPGFQQL